MTKFEDRLSILERSIGLDSYSYYSAEANSTDNNFADADDDDQKENELLKISSRVQNLLDATSNRLKNHVNEEVFCQ